MSEIIRCVKRHFGTAVSREIRPTTVKNIEEFITLLDEIDYERDRTKKLASVNNKIKFNKTNVQNNNAGVGYNQNKYAKFNAQRGAIASTQLPAVTYYERDDARTGASATESANTNKYANANTYKPMNKFRGNVRNVFKEKLTIQEIPNDTNETLTKEIVPYTRGGTNIKTSERETGKINYPYRRKITAIGNKEFNEDNDSEKNFESAKSEINSGTNSEENLENAKSKNKVKIDTIKIKKGKKPKIAKNFDQFEIDKVVELNDNNNRNAKSKKRVDNKEIQTENKVAEKVTRTEIKYADIKTRNTDKIAKGKTRNKKKKQNSRSKNKQPREIKNETTRIADKEARIENEIADVETQNTNEIAGEITREENEQISKPEDIEIPTIEYNDSGNESRNRGISDKLKTDEENDNSDSEINDNNYSNDS